MKPHEKLVLASQKIFKAETLVILVHDTPELWGDRDIITGVLDPSTSVLIDTSMKFIKWAADRNYSILDINIPKSNLEKETFSSSKAANEIMLSLWDNHLQYISTLTKICFIGIGESYQGIVHLIGERDLRVLSKAVINFVGNFPLKSLSSNFDETMVDWYFKNSLVFTNDSHNCWKESEEKRPRKKFGRVLKSDSDGIISIINERFDEATDFILDAFEEWSDEESD
ncbi:hypothetical protein Kpol_1003p37, partial [Vanderwaltozyma polyspora DSM 70294]